MSQASLTPVLSDRSYFELTGNPLDGALNQTPPSSAAFESSVNRVAATLAALRSAPARSAPAVVTPTLSDGKLVIRGTTGNDTISVVKSGNKIKVGTSLFAAASVERIVVVGDSGNDTIEISAQITKGTLIYGGTGDDTILGGGGKDEILGGHGTDTIKGRGGDDLVYGGQGVDALSGGAGTNTVRQGSRSLTQLMTKFEERIVTLTNRKREAAGLGKLTIDNKLAMAAQIQSNNMNSRYQFFIDGGSTKSEAVEASLAHELDGVLQPTLDNRFDYVGYEWSAIRENIAQGYTTAASVVEGWYNSPGHKANMLATDVVSMAVGVTKAADGTFLFTQVFGKTL